MIAYIKGEITFKSPTYILVETGGIGYHVNVSLNTYAQIEKLEKVKILTHLQVKEDSHTLYGFAEEAERSMVCYVDFRFGHRTQYCKSLVIIYESRRSKNGNNK